MKYPKKSLGQNFLIDHNVKRKIISSIKLINKKVLEIGPGKGFLTDEILKHKPKLLTLVEKDNFMAQDLKYKYRNNKNVKIYNKDILKFDIEKEIRKNTLVFGNLPYNISSQILVKFLKFKKWPPKFSNLVFMFQKEMSERVVGKFNSNSYGRLSILTDFRLKILKKFDVSPNCFTPRPKVNSTVMYFEPKKNISYNIKNIDNLEKITNIFFSNKRKMINKSFKKIFRGYQNIKLKNKLDLTKRPSEIHPNTYYEITELYERS
tara:strand:- start:2664 stop:3452 length:789 start_codon:yes stop_codon:yes gene_type:complete